MSATRSVPAAFTLIELLVAVALGLAVVGTLFAVFRASMRTFEAARRMERENDVVGQAFVAALEEVDFWQSVDDPTDAASQGLRAFGRGMQRSDWETADTRGLPFTPFDVVRAMSDAVSGKRPGGGDPIFDPAGAARPSAVLPAWSTLPLPHPREFARGWSAEPWRSDDPRTWYRGNGVEWIGAQGGNVGFAHKMRAQYCRFSMPFGRYAMLQHLKVAPVLGNIDGVMMLEGPLTQYDASPSKYWRSTPTFGQVTARHTWLPNQIAGLRNALGYYGLLDYLPANAFAHYYGATADADLGGGARWVDVDEQTHLGHAICPASGFAMAPVGGAYAIFPRSPWSFTDRRGTPPLSDTAAYPDAAFIGDGTSFNRSHVRTGFSRNEAQTWDTVITAMRTIMPLRPLLVQRPSDWPDAQFGVARLVASRRFVTLCVIRWSDPGTGTTRELQFNGWGTTLRGARQQRRPDAIGGWARWVDAASPSNGWDERDPERNDPTLDSYR